MGSSPTETGHRPDEAQVTVTLTRGFWIGAFEVTQGEWKRIVGTLPDRGPTAEFGLGDDIPVYWVNYGDAETFCRRLTELARRSGAVAAEYEFAFRPKRSGSMPAVPARPRRSRSEMDSGEIRPTSRRQRSAAPRRSAATRRMPGESSTCTATFSSGAATGTTLAFPEAPIRICTRSEGRRIGMARTRASAAAAPGMTTRGRADRRSGFAMKRSGVRIISVFAWRLRRRERPSVEY